MSSLVQRRCLAALVLTVSVLFAVAASAAGAGTETTAGHWKLTSVPSGVNNLSCRSATSCIAVLSSGKPAARWDGQTWTRERVPVLDSLSALEAATCPSESLCLGLGNNRWGGGRQQFLVERTDHGWSTLAAPRRQATARAISCAAVDDCWAVGEVVEDSLTGAAFAEHWDGRRWSMVSVPHAHSGLIKGAGPIGSGIIVSYELRSVSCATARMCLAVGRGYGGQTVMRWNGSHWKLSKLTLPKLSQGHVGVESVSCVSPKFCMAVGGGDYVLSYRWNGHRWSRVRMNTLLPSRKDVFGPELNKVACVSATDCTATGVNTSSRAKQPPLTERWNGHRWRVVSSAGSKNAASCDQAGACVLTHK